MSESTSHVLKCLRYTTVESVHNWIVILSGHHAVLQLKRSLVHAGIFLRILPLPPFFLQLDSEGNGSSRRNLCLLFNVLFVSDKIRKANCHVYPG